MHDASDSNVTGDCLDTLEWTTMVMLYNILRAKVEHNRSDHAFSKFYFQNVSGRSVLKKY